MQTRTRAQRGYYPTACDPDFTDDELEFLKAVDAFKSATHKRFPMWTDILKIIRSLGYVKTQLHTVPEFRPTPSLERGMRGGKNHF